MTRTRAEFVLEFRLALNQVPMSLGKLQAIAEQAFVDLHDVPVDRHRLDCPLAACCDDIRVVNACERHLDLITIEDLSKIGNDNLFAIPGVAMKGFIALHDSVSKELGDYLLSRYLDHGDLLQVLENSLVLRGDLRPKTIRWIRETFTEDLTEFLISLRGMSGTPGISVDVGKPDVGDSSSKEILSPHMLQYLDGLGGD